MSHGTISEYTFRSRTRRAMSWPYCAPKSKTNTVESGVEVAMRVSFWGLRVCFAGWRLRTAGFAGRVSLARSTVVSKSRLSSYPKHPRLSHVSPGKSSEAKWRPLTYQSHERDQQRDEHERPHCGDDGSLRGQLRVAVVLRNERRAHRSGGHREHEHEHSSQKRRNT